MTVEEFNMLGFGSEIISKIDGTIWYVFASNGNSTSIFKTERIDIWGHISYPDKLVFPYDAFLESFDVPFIVAYDGTKQDNDLMVRTGGKEGEPYSIVYPNFHMLDREVESLF
ncbi:MAG: hypothetical protein ACW99A_24005 [Candidatus Kariarchaeaceae archaeon]|jgi:hypothetical protein